MQPPVEYVRVSLKAKDILLKVKRRTGMEHWNEICRIAICRSLADADPPTDIDKGSNSSIDMDWKTFAGPIQNELKALILLRAKKDGIELTNKEDISDYFRKHLERGIISMSGMNSQVELFK